MVRGVISKSNLRIVEKYVFLGDIRYRIHVLGTNIVINVKAENDEEALEKALRIIEKIGLNEENLAKLREKFK